MKPYWFDEFDRMNRLLRKFAEPQAAKFIREIEQQRQMLEPPGYRALREWQSEIMPHSLCINDSLAAGFSSVVGQYDTLKLLAATQYSKPLADDLQRSLLFFRTPALPVIEAFSSNLLLASRDLAALRAFESTFAGQLLRIARSIDEAEDDEVPDRVSDITDLLKKQIKKSNRGPISIEGWIQIILALLFYISNALTMRQLELRLMDRLRTIGTQLEKMAPGERAKHGQGLRIVSASVLRVRAEPSARAQVLGKVTRNSLIRVMNTEGVWARVVNRPGIAGGSIL